MPRGARVLVALLLAALALLAPGAALAEERILSWQSDIEIRPDGTLEVAETIRVAVEGYQISRGIYRDFPLTFTDAEGRLREVGFTLLNVIGFAP